MNALANAAGARGETLFPTASSLPSKWILIAAWLPLSVIAGFRFLGDGMDFLQYYIFYNSIPRFFDVENSRFEVGYQVTAWLFSNILGWKYELFATLLAAIALGTKFHLFQKYLNHCLYAAILYVLIFYPLHEYTQLRSAVSLSFGYLAIHLYIEGKRKRSLLVFGAAFLFHYSILALACVFFMSGFMATINRLAVISLLSLIILFAMAANAIDILSIFTTYLGAFNPLVDDYAYAGEFYFVQNLLSVQNISTFLICGYSIISGKFSESDYNARMTVIAIAGLATALVFVESPVLGLRIRDMMVIAVIFLVCRDPFKVRDAPLWVIAGFMAVWQFRESIDQGLIL